MNDAESISRESVWSTRSARSAFPADLIAGLNSAACFFCAAFYGRNDVIYLDEAGFKSLTLIDVDKDKLEVMRGIYPAAKRIICADAFGTAEELQKEGAKFDVVIVDPFSNMMGQMIAADFDKFAAITSKYLLIAMSGEALRVMNIDPTVDGLNKWFQAQDRKGFVVERLSLRNSGLAEGIFWLVVRKKKKLFSFSDAGG